MVRSICLFLAAISAAPGAARYQRVYVFGDSYSDTGAGYVDGNGPTAVAYFAEKMRIDLRAANDPKATPESSLNFAVSGAGTGRGDGRRIGNSVLGLGMANQVDDFLERMKDKRVRFDPGKSLFFIAGGLNDGRLQSAESVEHLEKLIRHLYYAGARHFELAVLPESIPAFHDVSVRLNPEIARIPKAMKDEFKGIDIRLSQWGRFFDDVMQHPADYEIENTKDACAGRALFNEDATPCRNPDGYYYYHANHPSTAVHKAVGAKLFEELDRY